jgi:hypothetical protein
VLILLGALAAIAVASLAAQRLAPEPMQRLDRIPAMPGPAR